MTPPKAMKKVKKEFVFCSNCDAELIASEIEGLQFEYEQEGKIAYYKCPECGEKNSSTIAAVLNY